MKLYASILLVSFLCLERTVTALDCSNKTLQFCLDYLSRDGLDIDHIDDDLPTWNATVAGLQDRCRTFDKFTECMNGVTEDCSSHKYAGWIDAYEYLCKKSNLTLVVDYLECYTSPPVVSSAEKLCKRVFDFMAKELLNGSSNVPSNKMMDYCKLADNFFACLNKTLTTNCGEDAAKWQWTWDRTLSMPILKTCPGWYPTDDGYGDSGTSAWIIALIIILILVTGFMILAIVFLLIFILKRRKQRTRNQQVRRQTQSSLPPPPYSAVIFTSSEPGAEPQTHLVDSGVVLSPEDREGSDAPTASGDVVLPPPYMGDRPPVPAYDSIPTDPRKEEKKEGTDAFDAQPEVNADDMNSSDKPSDD